MNDDSRVTGMLPVAVSIVDAVRERNAPAIQRLFETADVPALVVAFGVLAARWQHVAHVTRDMRVVGMSRERAVEIAEALCG